MNKKAAHLVRRQLDKERRRQRTLWTTAVAAVVLLLAGVVGWAVYANQRADSYAAPPGASSDGSGIALGKGPVTVDVYADFMCPGCRLFESRAGQTLDRLVAEGKVTVVYHPVAYLDQKSSTEYSTRAASAAGCAAAGGRFRQYAGALFQRQPPEGGPGLSDDTLVSIGTAVGLDADAFTRCVREGEYRGWSEHVTDEASRRGVTGTPTVFVAGKEVDPSPEALTAAVTASP